MADNVRRCLEEAMSQIAILGPQQTDEAVGAFNAFRRGVMQASNSSAGELNGLLDSLHPKVPLLDFLVSLYGQKRTYRKQIGLVWTTLLSCDAWLRTAYDNRLAWSQFPDDLQSIMHSRERPTTPRAIIVPNDSESNVPSDSRVLAAVIAAEAAQAPKSARRSSSEVTFLREPPELQLQNVMVSISKCQKSKDRDEGLIAFDSFQKILNRLISQKDSAADRMLDEIEPKTLVFEFLVDVHTRNKMHRNRVCTVFKTILGIESWQRGFMRSSELCRNLPLELRLTVAGAVPESVETILTSEQCVSDPSLLSRHSSVLHGDGEGRIPRDMSKVTTMSLASMGSSMMLDSSDVFDAVTYDCKELQIGIKEMVDLSFRASPIASARSAFDRFAKGVRQTVRCLPKDYIDLLDSLEPKADILEFLVDLHTSERSKKRCNAIRSLLFRLNDMRAWNEVMDGDASLRDIMAEGLPGRGAPALVVSRCICGSSGQSRRSRGSSRKKKVEERASLLAVKEDELGRSWYSRAFGARTSHPIAEGES